MRKTLHGGWQQLLSCYPDGDLADNNFRISAVPLDCPKDQDCCLNEALSKSVEKLASARSGLESEGDRKEVIERRRVLRQLEKHSAVMQRDDCRKFGDAYFVLFCPHGHAVLTTNVRDIKPMADALKVEVATYS
jgi:hypothetical protein